MRENSKSLNQKDVLNAVLAKETAPQWLLFYRNERVADVYGMLELERKTLKAIVVVVNLNCIFFIHL